MNQVKTKTIFIKSQKKLINMKKMSLELARKINSQLSILKTKVPSLNKGGCGVFACYFAEKMISLGFDAKIIELGVNDFELMLMGYVNPFDRSNPEQNNARIHQAATKNLNPDKCNIHSDWHYCVKIDDFYFDSEDFSRANAGHVKLRNIYEIVTDIPLNDFEYIAIKNRGNSLWNHAYKPTLNNTVKKIIESSLAFLS